MRSLLALALLGSSPFAQSGVIVVDDDAGPGVDFTDLQEALDAASAADVVLVREGSYPGPVTSAAPDRFSITGARTVVAEAGAAVLLEDGIHIESLPADETVLLRGLTVDGTGYLLDDSGSFDIYESAVALWVDDCDGAVWLEDCTLLSPGDGALIDDWPPDALLITDGSSLFATRCDVSGGSAWFLGGLKGRPIYAWGGSQLHLYDSLVTTDQIVHIGSATEPPELPPAARFADSFLFASGTTIVGGEGVDEVEHPSFGHICGSDGGPALELLGASPAGSLFDSSLVGGPPGEDTACQTAEQGVPAVVEAGTLTEAAGTARSLSAPATVEGGTPLTLSLTGESGDVVLLFVSHGVQLLHVPQLSGTLAPLLPYWVLVPGTLPASGTRTVDFPAPSPMPGTEARTLYLQAVFAQGNELVLSSGTAVTCLAAAP